MAWWLVPVLVVPLFFLWNVVHEGAHALAAIASGRRIVSFKPWPHKEPDWGFVFGAVRFEGVNTTPILIVPYVVDVLAYVGLALAFGLTGNAILKTVFALALLCPVVDTTMGVQARYRGNLTSDLAQMHWGWALPFLYTLLAYILVFGGFVVPWMLGC